MNSFATQYHGVVSEFDAVAGCGLIDADNGDIVLFNTGNLDERQLQSVDVGAQVEYMCHEDTFGPRADVVRLLGSFD